MEGKCWLITCMKTIDINLSPFDLQSSLTLPNLSQTFGNNKVRWMRIY